MNQPSFKRSTMLKLVGASSLAAAATPLFGASDADDVTKISRYIGKIDPKHAAKGLAYDFGAMLPLTGYAAYYGVVQGNGLKLAVKHIEALGGPRFNVIYKDNKGGDPQLGVSGTRELGLANVPAMLASYTADLGSMLPGIAQYKIFTLDGGGGVGVFAQGKPYFWGSLAITPNDAVPGVMKYVARKMPSAKRVMAVGWDIGPATSKVIDSITRNVKAEGLQYIGTELTKIGSTDYSATLEKIKSDKPDIVLLFVYGDDTGYFIKQYATSGINKPVVAFTHTGGAAKIAGPAYDGLFLAFDYFDTEPPSNDWARFFVDAYKKEYNSVPDYYAANYYEDMFIMWSCIRGVLAQNGNPKDGTQLDKVFRATPSFPSLYGGSGDKPGTIAFDLETHDVKRRQLSFAVWKDAKVRPLAYFNINGADFRLA